MFIHYIMPGYQINFDLKTGRNAMGLMNANGNDLVKATSPHFDKIDDDKKLQLLNISKEKKDSF